MLKAPVFLVGAERSGSTMLRLMLNDHPEVCWLNEFEYAVDKINNDGICQNLSDYKEWLSTHRTFSATGFCVEKNLNYPQLVDSFLSQKKEIEQKKYIGATVHRHFDRLLKIWPDAKFIHILRDPRDVSKSVLNIGWVGHIFYGPDRWIDAEKTWDRLVQNITPDRYVEIRFEKLLENPERELLSAWKLIGVKPENYVMNFWKKSTYSKPDPKLSLQWKRKLTSKEVQLIESRVGTMLNSKGYNHSGFDTIKLSWFDHFHMRTINRVGRAMKRRRRYGTTMWIINILTPLIPIKKLQKTVRLKLNEIERSQLK